MSLVDVGLDLNYELAEGLSLNGGAWYASWDRRSCDELDLYIGLTKPLALSMLVWDTPLLVSRS